MSRAARLGAFIFTTLAILAVGIFIIGSRQYLFTSTYRLKAQFCQCGGPRRWRRSPRGWRSTRHRAQHRVAAPAGR